MREATEVPVSESKIGGTRERLPSSPPPRRPPFLNSCRPTHSALTLNSNLPCAFEQETSSPNLSLCFLLKKEQDKQDLPTSEGC